MSGGLGRDGGMKLLFKLEERTEDLVASFGAARLVRSPQGRFEVRGGSETDRILAREWVLMFLQDTVVRWN